MASFFYTICLITALSIAFSFSFVAAGEEFKVGNALGWRQPGFEYKNDSVIVVDKWEFYHCNRTHPSSSAKDGNTTVNLDRAGSFYFVSGDPEHCKNGQRLVIDVYPPHPISHSPPEPISPAPSPLSSSAAVMTSIPLKLFSVLI